MQLTKLLSFIYNLLFLVGMFALYDYGYFHYLWETDFSKLTFVSIALTFLTMFWIAFGQWEKKGIFAVSNLVMGLGLAGTVIGASYMFFALDFAALGAGDLNAAIATFSIAAGTALQNTLVGIVCNLILVVKMNLMGEFDQ